MSILKRRDVALVILVLAVLLTIVFSGARALREERAEALRVYHNGANASGLSIANDLSARADAARSLALVAERALVAPQLAAQARERALALAAAASVKEASALNAELESAVDALHEQLSKAPLSVSDASAVSNQYAEFASRGRVIAKDPVYNNRVRAFNESLARFPANVIARLVGVPPLDNF